MVAVNALRTFVLVGASTVGACSSDPLSLSGVHQLFRQLCLRQLEQV